MYRQITKQFGTTYCIQGLILKTAPPLAQEMQQTLGHHMQGERNALLFQNKLKKLNTVHFY